MRAPGGVKFLEKLLDGAEVEWQPLELLAKIRHGKDWKGLNSGNIPVYGSGGIMGYVDASTYDKPTVLIPRKGSITNIFYVDTPFWNVDTIFYTDIDVSKIIPKYLYHYVKTIDFMSLDPGSGRPSLTQAILNPIQIPIPCPSNPKKSLEIQADIVRILDAFTELTSELTSELTARKKQYDYYRDQLLSFDEGEVEWRTLGELATLITKGTTPKRFASEGINFIKLESFENNRINPHKFMFVLQETHMKELKRSILEENDVLFAIAGATIGKCAIVDKRVLPANTNQALAIIRLGEQVNAKFVFYCMQTTGMREYIAKFNKTSAQPNITLQQISDFKIPVPPLSEQTRIAASLDDFDSLTNSITEGLPREIELRQKQYEHYRDLLLSFPEKVSA